ncbi:MAG TPA: hypothetical protein VHD36_19290 [Pirellulales bacterium]|nr:hypothetical protein [Pirellulales bacterium]
MKGQEARDSTMLNMLRTLLRSLLVAACLAILATPALAQGKKNEPSGRGGAGIPDAAEQTEPNYVFPYFLVVLSIGLGLYVLNKPTRRKNMDEKDTAPA